MLMSAIEGLKYATPTYPELAGKRVLVTGLSYDLGVDIARAFADARARLVLQTDALTEEMQAVAEMIAVAAADVKLYAGSSASAEDAVRMARNAMTAFGGVDAVVNLVPLAAGAATAAATHEEIEAAVAQRLTMACLAGKIAANRMRLTMIDGLVLNVAMLPARPSTADRAFASVAKAALTGMTRGLAEEWTPHSVRFNAIAPQCAGGAGEPALSGEIDVAALALFLASGRGRMLSGHVFEAAAGC
jgi:NAD(P)-dependent dehydrogenase (short-subunit alcohol dehydrogenase family)